MSKAVRFEISEITNGFTRVMTVPDKDGTLATLDDVMTLVDGGMPDTVYGGMEPIDGGGVT